MQPHTLQSGDLPLEAVTATPFDDIASIHALYEPRVFRFLLFSARDRDLAETLTQDTFLTAWRFRSSFRGDCSIPTWLLRIAVNLLRSHTRTDSFRFWKQASASCLDATELASYLAHPSASAESRLLAQEKLAGIWNSVQRLSPKQRDIFILRFMEELELAEIAEIMKIPLPTVKSHLYRAIDRIRTEHQTSAAASNVRRKSAHA